MKAKEFSQSETRLYSDALLNAIDEGVFDKNAILTSLIAYMSEQDVKDLCITEGFFTE